MLLVYFHISYLVVNSFVLSYFFGKFSFFWDRFSVLNNSNNNNKANVDFWVTNTRSRVLLVYVESFKSKEFNFLLRRLILHIFGCSGPEHAGISFLIGSTLNNVIPLPSLSHLLVQRVIYCCYKIIDPSTMVVTSFTDDT